MAAKQHATEEVAATVEPVSPPRQRGILLHKPRGPSDPSTSRALWLLPQPSFRLLLSSRAFLRLALQPNAL